MLKIVEYTTNLSIFSLFICFTVFCSSTLSKNFPYEKTSEKWYQAIWCSGNNGSQEVLLSNHRRVDCITEDYAVEIEFAQKWHQAVGQALDYGMLTDKKPGIVLILRNTKDHHYLKQLEEIIEHYKLPIKLWQLGP